MNTIELIKNHYKNGFNSNVTAEELITFITEYKLLKELKEKYASGLYNRKELSQEIIQKTSYLNDLIKIFEFDLSNNKDLYQFPEYITNHYKIFDILLKLANTNTNKYDLKTFYTTQTGSNETIHGYKETNSSQGETYVLGEKSIINQINDTNFITPSKLQYEITNIINNNYSLVITTNAAYDWHILPQDSELKTNNKIELKTKGFISNLYCYSYNDDLGQAINKLNNYIQTYGGNVDNISINNLIIKINNLNNEIKVKKLLHNKHNS